MIRERHIGVLGIVLAALVGCSTIGGDHRQMIKVDSSPTDADVLVNGMPAGRTPLSVPLKPKRNVVVTVEKAGYVAQERLLGTKEISWFFGTLLSSTSGGQSEEGIEYSPNSYYFTLKRAKPSIPRAVSIRHKKIRDYILLNNENLRENIYWGRGQYLSSLYKILKVKEREKLQALKVLQNLNDKYYHDTPRFVDAVITKFERRAK